MDDFFNDQQGPPLDAAAGDRGNAIWSPCGGVSTRRPSGLSSMKRVMDDFSTYSQETSISMSLE
jgi:hypothetical protein